MELHTHNTQTWKLFDMHWITLWLISEHHMLSMKHVVYSLKVTKYNIYLESQTDSCSHRKGCALFSVVCITYCTTPQIHTGYGLDLIGFVFIFHEVESERYSGENSRNHSYLEIFNMQNLLIQVSLKYLLKMY